MKKKKKKKMTISDKNSIEGTLEISFCFKTISKHQSRSFFVKREENISFLKYYVVQRVRSSFTKLESAK